MDRSLLRAPSGRLRTPWRLGLATLFFFLLSLVGSVAFLSVDALFFDLDEQIALVGFGTASGLAVTIGVWFATRTLDRRSIREFGLEIDDAWWRDFAVGLALGFGLIAALYLAGIALGVYRPRFAPTAPEGLSVLAAFALVTLFMCVVGFYEELLFRGYFLVNVAEGMTAFLGARASVFGAVALSSLGFGAVHGLNPNMTRFGLATIAVAGVALGFGYVLTGRLALPVGFHITWNLAHFVFGLPVSGLDLGVQLLSTERVGSAIVHGGAVGPEGGVLGFLTAVVGCLAVVVYGHRVGGGVRTDIASSPERIDAD